MRVGFLPANVDGAGCYRLIFPMAYLGRLGHEASMPSFILKQGASQVRPFPGDGLLERIPPGDFDVLFLEETVPDADLYVFQLGTFRWQLDWAKKLKARGKLVVLDTDDDVWASPVYNPAVLDPRRSPDNNYEIGREMVELADAVTTATQSLAEVVSEWNPDVTVLRNRLHWPMWEQITPVHEDRPWSRFRVGYMGGFDWHAADMKLIARELRRWLRRNPEVEFVAAGDHRFHDLIGVPEDQRVTTRKVWFRNLDLPHVTACMDVGLVPLIRNRFNEGKSWLKGMEYAACGIPCLATPTREYQEWVADGENGFLCEKPIDFIEALDTLLVDRDQLGRMAAHAYGRARASALDNHIREWERVYGRILGVGDHTDHAATAAAA